MAERDPEVPEPRLNPELIGHETAEQDYLSAWTSGRLAHAWLICGPRGIGKATLAYRMARHALAQGPAPGTGADLFGAVPPPPTLAMSPDHPVFRRVGALGHADFRAIERPWADSKETRRKAVIPVESIREIGGFLSMTPAEGGWRAVVVDAADEMNPNAANAILKVLEEPPRRALLFLVAHNPERLLPTIRSRCRRLDLRSLADDQVADLIGRYRPSFAADDVAALTALANGSIGRALALAEEGGVELFRELVALLVDLPRLNVGRLHALADKALRGEGFRILSDLLAWWLARLTVQTARDGEMREVVAGEGALVRRLRAAADPAAWAAAWAAVGELANRTEGINLDRKRSLLLMLLRLETIAQGKTA